MDAFNNRGNAYFAESQFDRAIEDYNQAIRLNPDYANAFINRGNVYRKGGQYDRAILDFDEAIRLSPQNPLAFYSRGVTYGSKGRSTPPFRTTTRRFASNPTTRMRFTTGVSLSFI